MPVQPTGLTVADVDRVLPEFVRSVPDRTGRATSRRKLAESCRHEPKPGLWWAFRQFAPLVHARTGGPWSFGPRPTYVAARTEPHAGAPDASTHWLVRRYLEGFGPASVQDIAQLPDELADPLWRGRCSRPGSRPTGRRG